MVGEAVSGSGLAASWTRVRNRLRSEYGEVAFENWLTRLDVADFSGDSLVLSAPSRFMRDWVAPRYGDRIRALWRLEDPSVRTVDIVVGEGSALSFQQTPPRERAPARSADRPDRPIQEEAVVALLDPKLTFGNFVVGKPNEFAHAAARRVSESDDAPFNPLFIYGGVGLGKTHLMQGIAWSLRQRQPHRKVMYLSAEKFMYRFVRALRFKNIMGFKELFRSVDVLMIDDVQFMDG